MIGERMGVCIGIQAADFCCSIPGCEGLLPLRQDDVCGRFGCNTKVHHMCSIDWVSSHGYPELPGISPWCYNCLCEKYLCQEAHDDVFMPEAPATAVVSNAARAPSAADAPSTALALSLIHI